MPLGERIDRRIQCTDVLESSGSLPCEIPLGDQAYLMPVFLKVVECVFQGRPCVHPMTSVCQGKSLSDQRIHPDIVVLGAIGDDPAPVVAVQCALRIPIGDVEVAEAPPGHGHCAWCPGCARELE